MLLLISHRLFFTHTMSRMLRQLSLIERRSLSTLSQRVLSAPILPTAARRLTQTKNFLAPVKKVTNTHVTLIFVTDNFIDVYCFQHYFWLGSFSGNDQLNKNHHVYSIIA